MQEREKNDLILAPNEFAFISDTQSGNVNVIVGPNQKSLAASDRPMVFDSISMSFKVCNNVKEAIQYFPFVDSRSYVVLQNPYENETTPHPIIGKANSLVELKHGAKINLKGPVTFPLWPGQVAKVIEGHQLRSNQYLLVKVYNEETAKKNWRSAVMKAAGDENSADKAKQDEIPSLTTGQLLIIKGTEVSFYIPPTGIEVLQDDSTGNYVRNAVTIERLQYCILLDESGDKRYVKGPAVVFPSPTEKFVSHNNQVVMHALELNENMGLHIKVIADYEENGQKYKTGQELFITGNEQKIYFPRTEHAIIKYSEDPIHYAVAIPKGEARYVLNKKTGEVSMIRGPKMYLPDARDVVLVRRVLDEKLVNLWFPGNNEAILYNRKLAEKARDIGQYVRESSMKESAETVNTFTKSLAGIRERRDKKEKKALLKRTNPAIPAQISMELEFDEKIIKEDLAAGCYPQKQSSILGIAPPPSPPKGGGDSPMNRKSKYTPPRSVTLDTKYEGAVNINVWPGFAVQVVSNTGERQIITGPKSILLEYDQILESMELSTGTPKTDEKLIKTAYLRIRNNRISDLVQAVTKDLVEVEIRVNYKVNFEGQGEKWFDVENYVKFLTQHCRSIIRNAIKQYGIEEINNSYINIIRDTILGIKKDTNAREGRFFDENCMRIYDVEVLKMKIGDETISTLLTEVQHSTVSLAIKVAQEKKKLEANKKIESFKQETDSAVFQTLNKKLELLLEENKSRAKIEEATLQKDLSNQATIDKIEKSKLARIQANINQKIEEKQALTDISTKSYVERLQAIQPELTRALIAMGNKELAGKLAKNLPNTPGAFGSLFGDTGGMKKLLEMVKGTPIEKGLKELDEMDKE